VRPSRLTPLLQKSQERRQPATILDEAIGDSRDFVLHSRLPV